MNQDIMNQHLRIFEDNTNKMYNPNINLQHNRILRNGQTYRRAVTIQQKIEKSTDSQAPEFDWKLQPNSIFDAI